MYGSSERVGGAFITSPEWLDHPGSVGRPVGCTVHILDDDGNGLPARQLGRICFGDDLVDVGDVGFLDEDGYLYNIDRKSSEIRIGAEAVYPQQVEDVLITHPRVLDAAVYGVPGPGSGMRVRAMVQLVDGADAVSERELIAYCRERLTEAQCPVAVEFGTVPRSDHGKVYRRHLQSRYLTAAPRVAA
jgi:long-chain acyl-CoA synthetase